MDLRKKNLELNAEIQYCSQCIDVVNSRSRLVNGYGDLNAGSSCCRKSAW